MSPHMWPRLSSLMSWLSCGLAPPALLFESKKCDDRHSCVRCSTKGEQCTQAPFRLKSPDRSSSYLAKMELFLAILLSVFTAVSALPNYAMNSTGPSNNTGKTVTYNWDIAWTTAAPDGVERPVIGINGQWPCPELVVDYGDRVIINVYNGLGNESTSIHWHGITQYGNSEMDGTVGTSQCPIAPGQTMTYDWVVSQVQLHCLPLHLLLTDLYRPTRQGHTGITLMMQANIQMVSGGP